MCDRTNILRMFNKSVLKTMASLCIFFNIFFFKTFNDFSLVGCGERKCQTLIE